jgi:hypothetical protein
MATFGNTETPTHVGACQLYGKANAPTADSGWGGGVVAMPLLALAVLGYQVVVTVLKVVNRERPAAHEGTPA